MESDRRIGSVVRNPITQDLYLYIGVIGRGHILFPLKYPELDVMTTYSLSIYKEISPSLEAHVQTKVQEWSDISEGDVISWSTDRWSDYLEVLVAAAETYAEDYDFDYIDDADDDNHVKEKFYRDMAEFMVTFVKDKTLWSKNTYAAKLAIENFLKDTHVDMSEVFKGFTGGSYKDYLELEFAHRCTKHIMPTIIESGLYESTV